MQYDELIKCALCPELGKDHVLSCGHIDCKLMLIGQSPGKNEVLQNQPFVGRCGEYVNALLARLGLNRSEVYIANALKCRPPNNRKGKPEEISNCFDAWLADELRQTNTPVVLLLGKDAWSIIPEAMMPFPYHGSFCRTARRAYVFSYHPSYFLRRQALDEFLEIGKIIQRITE